MRVLDCDCGHTLQAANDDDLTRVTREHVDQEHSEKELSEGDVRQLVQEKAYTAMDS